MLIDAADFGREIQQHPADLVYTPVYTPADNAAERTVANDMREATDMRKNLADDLREMGREREAQHSELDENDRDIQAQERRLATIRDPIRATQAELEDAQEKIAES